MKWVITFAICFAVFFAIGIKLFWKKKQAKSNKSNKLEILEFGEGGISMDNNEKKKKEPWRIVLGIIAIAYIVYMWVEKDIITIYTTMPKEQAVPLIATTIAVSLIKVAVITGGFLLIKWITSKFKNK